MSGISGIGGGGLDLSALRQSAFKQLDTNGNGKISKDEFVAGRPQGVRESQASDLFSKIDSKGTGEVSQSELDSGLEKNKPQGHSGLGGGSGLSSDTLSVLLQAISGGNSSSTSNASSNSSTSSNDLASKIFDKIDTDHNGKVSKDEFVKNRPQFISESDASKQFDAIDKNGTGSITKDQFAANAPQPSFGRGGFGGSGDSAGGSNSSSGDLLNQLLEAINSYTKNSYSGFNNNVDYSSLLKTSA